MTRQHQVAKSRPAQTSVKRFDTHSQHGPSGQETPCPVNSLPVWPPRRTLTATGSLCRCTRAVVGSPMALRISTVLGIMIMTFIRLILGTGLPPVNLSIIASRLESIWILRDEEKAWQKTGRVKAVILACEFFLGGRRYLTWKYSSQQVSDIQCSYFQIYFNRTKRQGLILLFCLKHMQFQRQHRYQS